VSDVDSISAAAGPGERGPISTEDSIAGALAAVAARETQSVPLGALAVALGARAHALALLILVLPETIPLPVPSISIAIGIPLVVIAAHLALHGDRAALPERAAAVRLPIATLNALLRWIGPMLTLLERAAHARWRALTRHERLAGVVCTYLAVILALPIPFVNLAPALCLAAIALGLLRRDGILMAIGFAGTAALTAALAYAGLALGGLVLATR
jgi:hypothetical protein